MRLDSYPRHRTKVDAVDQVGLPAKADQKVIRLDVAMDEALVVDVLDALK